MVLYLFGFKFALYSAKFYGCKRQGAGRPICDAQEKGSRLWGEFSVIDHGYFIFLQVFADGRKAVDT